MYVQAKAWVMLSEEMPWIGRVSLELVWMTEISVMGLEWGQTRHCGGCSAHSEGIIENWDTSQITTIQKLRFHIFPIVFLCLTIDNFEHTG